MKKLVLALSLVVAVTFSVAFAATTEDAVNKHCPVAGKELKKDSPTVEATYKDKKYHVGFCCNNCKGKWEAEKDPFAKWKVEGVNK